MSLAAIAMLFSAQSVLGQADEPHDTPGETLDHDALVKRDLFAVITLHGHACGEVTSFQRHAGRVYMAVCASGDRYRIAEEPVGHVSVNKQ